MANAKGTRQSKTELVVNPNEAKRLQDINDAMRMYIDGRDIGYIAGALGVSRPTAHNYIMQGVKDTTLAIKEMHEMVMYKSLMRLEGMYAMASDEFRRKMSFEKPEYDQNIVKQMLDIVKTENDIVARALPTKVNISVDNYFEPTFSTTDVMYKKQNKRVKGEQIEEVIIEDDGTAREDPRITKLGESIGDDAIG